MDNKKLADVVLSLKEKIKENSEKLEQFQERLEKLENPGANENEDVNDNLGNYVENAPSDVNNKLSNYSKRAVLRSRGPMKTDDLFAHFTSNDFGKKKKEAMAVIKKFPNNIDEVKNQLSNIREDLEDQVTRRKKENDLDVQLIQRIKKFNETLQKEQEKEKKPNTKQRIQTSTNPSHFVTTRSKDKLFPTDLVGVSPLDKDTIPVKETERKGKKRKLKIYDDVDADSSSSQEPEVEHVTANYKRLKLNSRTSSQESMESKHKSGRFTQYRQPRPVIDSESSQSSLDENSTETVKKMKTDVKRLKQPESNNEETVHEKQLSFKEKHFRRD